MFDPLGNRTRVPRLSAIAFPVAIFLLAVPAHALVRLTENATSSAIQAESCDGSTSRFPCTVECVQSCDGLGSNRVQIGIHQCAFGFPLGAREVESRIQTDIEISPTLETQGNVVAAQFSYDIWWDGLWCIVGSLASVKVGRIDVWLDVYERATPNLVYREQVHSLDVQDDFGFFDGVIGGGFGRDEGSRRSAFTVLLQRGKQYTVRLTLRARTELGVTAAYIGLRYDGDGRGAGWNDLHITVGQDARGVVAGLQAQFDSLGTRFENHGHVYLTGHGEGHNNTEAKTSGPVYFEELEHPPAFLEDPEDREPLPARSALHAPTPNPVARTGTISYELPADAQVTIRLYNVQGRVVRTFVDGFRSAGKHEIELDTAGLAGGVYFYSLRTPKYYESRKVVLAK